MAGRHHAPAARTAALADRRLTSARPTRRTGRQTALLSFYRVESDKLRDMSMARRSDGTLAAGTGRIQAGGGALSSALES